MPAVQYGHLARGGDRNATGATRRDTGLICCQLLKLLIRSSSLASLFKLARGAPAHLEQNRELFVLRSPHTPHQGDILRLCHVEGSSAMRSFDA
jgi:hypothetical protein